MNKNHLRHTLLAGMMVISLYAKSQPPYMIETIMSENKIVGFTNQKLLIIDFWATWCAPCAPATKQLEILQETKRNDVYIVSVSDESSELISNYLKRNPIRLAVLRDYLPNSLINLFKVKSRPYAVLLTLDGDVLYQGHPSNITKNMIEKYAERMKTKPKKSWKEMFAVMQNTAPQSVSPPVTKEFTLTKQPQREQKMYIDNGMFYYIGTLSGLIQYLAGCSSYQVDLSDLDDYGVSMSCSESDLLKSQSAVLQLVENRLSLNLRVENKLMEAFILQVVNPKRLWDDRQINWSEDSRPAYMVGTDRIDADNVTIKDIANLLSDVKGYLYYYDGNDTAPHDWSFHYRYDKLMTEDLESNFGIAVKKEKIYLPIYIFSSQ